MGQQEILDYIRQTPHNSNVNVVKGMLNNSSGGDMEIHAFPDIDTLERIPISENPMMYCYMPATPSHSYYPVLQAAEGVDSEEVPTGYWDIIVIGMNGDTFEWDISESKYVEM